MSSQMSLVNQTRGDKFTQLENVSPLEQQAQKDVIRLHHQTRQPQPVSNSPSSSLDSSESSEDEEEQESDEDEEEEDEEDEDDLEVDEDEDDADHEYAADDDDDDDDDEDGADEPDNEEDEDADADEDEDDDESQEENSDAIVDPVGDHHIHHHPSTGGQFIDSNGPTAIDEYYDVPYVNSSYEESSITHSSSTSSDLSYSERMLEVTRKLVRSTERDPDRDLRKQVLLRTALRRLPHFLTYNHYSESFDQSFRMHDTSVNDNNNATALECLSPSQYYEHHSIHHLEQQPKSYYHSVQPNALQMSTTSLRMLDLNDDSGAEIPPVTGTTETNHQERVTYESTEHVTQESLDRQHANENSNLYAYSQHNGSLDVKDSESSGYGGSMLETSPNSCDSDLALFSPPANKRTSSSIGLDEQMEIDNTGTVANQYKKLKKRESSNLCFTPSWTN